MSAKDGPYTTIPFLGYLHCGEDGLPETDEAGNYHGVLQIKSCEIEGVRCPALGFGFRASIGNTLKVLVQRSGHLKPSVVAERARLKKIKARK